MPVSKLRDAVDRHLLSHQLGRDLYVVKKARLLVWIHLVTITCSSIMLVFSIWVHSPMFFSLLVFTAVATGLLFLFKLKGRIDLSGNLLVALVCVLLLVEILPTGGLYSDNVPWLVTVPTLSFLFTNKTSGLAWSALVTGVLAGLFYLEITAETSYRLNTLDLTPDYYFVSYTGLFIGLFSIVLLFVKGNDEIVQALREKSKALRRQKRHAEDQNELLRVKEVELLRSNRDLEMFAYVASHDLKEPLRMVNAYTQLLQRKIGSTLPEKEQEYMAFVREGASRMQTMLDDLLAFSRIGKESEEAQRVDLNSTLLIVRNNLKVSLDNTGGEILVERLPVLIGKNTHYLQVFQNLVANGLKFHKADVPPRIRITTRRVPTKGEVIIAIEDNGIGIQEKDLNAIFGVFQRLNAKTDYEGSGIGLATVQRIVEGLDGRIEVTSVYGEGTCFALHLPERLLAEDQSSKIVDTPQELTSFAMYS